MPDKCLVFLAKQDDVFRAGRCHAVNGVGFGIIHTNANDLARVWYGRLEYNFGDENCRRQVCAVFQGQVFFSIQKVAQSRVLRDEGSIGGRDSIAVEDTVERLALIQKGSDIHDLPASNDASRWRNIAVSVSL